MDAERKIERNNLRERGQGRKKQTEKEDRSGAVSQLFDRLF